jgi:two-component system, OmpR family, sensor histidine kinase KdpD
MSTDRAKQDVARKEPATERVLVCVDTGAEAEQLVRAAAGISASLQLPWVAVHVETAREARLSESDRQEIAHTLHVAEQLGGESATLTGQNIADEVIAYAHSRNVNKIIVGKSKQSKWSRWLQPSVPYQLTRKCDDIDVYVIGGKSEAATSPAVRRPTAIPVKRSYAGYFGALLVIALCTGLGFLMFSYFAPPNIIMVYLLGVVAVSSRFGRGPSVLASLLGVAAFDFFFIPPYYTFDVEDKHYWVIFAVMLVTGLVISTLTAHLRFQVESARSRESRTAALYAMSRDLVHVKSITAVIEAAAWHIGQVFDAEVILALPESISLDMREVRRSAATSTERPFPDQSAPVAAELGQLGIHEWQVPPVRLQIASTTENPLGGSEHEAAQWAFEHGEPAGFGTHVLPSSKVLFVPMPAQERRIGVLGVQRRTQTFLTPDQVRLLETFAGQIALAIARVQSTEDAHKARLQGESERLRGSFLNAVSHELRTPLTTIVDASSTLLERGASLPVETQHELAKSIYDEGNRLNRLVSNILDMTRLESGAVKLKPEWHSLDDLIGGALSKLAGLLGDRSVQMHLPADLPLVFVDELLMHQLLANLLENSHRVAPQETSIEISASVTDGRLELEVADRGPSFVGGEERRIFEKAYQSTSAAARAGAGIGLLICRAITELHSGWILAENRIGGGIVFRISLPQPAEQPSVR